MRSRSSFTPAREAASEAIIIFPEIFQCSCYICVALIMMVWLFPSFIQKNPKKNHLHTKLRTNRDNIWRFKDEPHCDRKLLWSDGGSCAFSSKRFCTLLEKAKAIAAALQHPWNAISSCCGNFPIDTPSTHTAALLALSWQGILFHTQTVITSLLSCYMSL